LLAGAQGYEYARLGMLEVAQGSYIQVTGYFETDKTFSARVDGTLSMRDEVLSVRGGVFDWLPENETWVVIWGELKSENGEAYLEFHNGHPLTQTKVPRPALTTEGERADVWLNVSIAGAKPNTFYQGMSEDRKSFALQNYQGSLGIQCLSGVVGRVSGRRSLSEIRPCSSV